MPILVNDKPSLKKMLKKAEKKPVAFVVGKAGSKDGHKLACSKNLKPKALKKEAQKSVGADQGQGLKWGYGMVKVVDGVLNLAPTKPIPGLDKAFKEACKAQKLPYTKTKLVTALDEEEEETAQT